MTEHGIASTSRHFRRRPTEIEATQWTGDNYVELKQWADTDVAAPGVNDVIRLWIVKTQKWAEFPVGTWIIRESDGIGFYPCHDDIFKDNYDEI